MVVDHFVESSTISLATYPDRDRSSFGGRSSNARPRYPRAHYSPVGSGALPCCMEDQYRSQRARTSASVAPES